MPTASWWYSPLTPSPLLYSPPFLSPLSFEPGPEFADYFNYFGFFSPAGLPLTAGPRRLTQRDDVQPLGLYVGSRAGGLVMAAIAASTEVIWSDTTRTLARHCLGWLDVALLPILHDSLLEDGVDEDHPDWRPVLAKLASGVSDVTAVKALRRISPLDVRVQVAGFCYGASPSVVRVAAMAESAIAKAVRENGDVRDWVCNGALVMGDRKSAFDLAVVWRSWDRLHVVLWPTQSGGPEPGSDPQRLDRSGAGGGGALSWRQMFDRRFTERRRQSLRADFLRCVRIGELSSGGVVGGHDCLARRFEVWPVELLQGVNQPAARKVLNDNAESLLGAIRALFRLAGRVHGSSRLLTRGLRRGLIRFALDNHRLRAA